MNVNFMRDNAYQKTNNNSKLKLVTAALCSLIPVTCYLIPVSCYLSTESQAATVHKLNDLQVIEVPISQTGLTRITVKGDRINNVFGVAGEYVMEADESQGQVFIRPMESVLGSISITVTTEGGHTQDLRLLPQNTPPEALILNVEENKNSRDAQGISAATRTIPSTDSISRNDIEDLLYACAEGRIPVGYLSVPLKLPSGDDPYLLIGEISNKRLRCLTYEVKNSESIPLILGTDVRTQTLEESSFAERFTNLTVLAILMPKKLLKPGESTHVFIAAKSL